MPRISRRAPFWFGANLFLASLLVAFIAPLLARVSTLFIRADEIA